VNERSAGRNGRACLRHVHQAFQFVDVGHPPLSCDRSVGQAASAAGELIGVGQRGFPGRWPLAIGILQPNEAGQVIGNGSVQVIGKALRRPDQTCCCRCIVAARMDRGLPRPRQSRNAISSPVRNKIVARRTGCRWRNKSNDGSVEAVKVESADACRRIADGRIKRESVFLCIYS